MTDQNQYRLRTGIPAGRIDADGLGSFKIRGHSLECEDYDTAAELVERYTVVSWPGEDPGPPEHSNAPDHAGPPDKDEDEDDVERGPPGRRGPPDHANNDNDNADDNGEDDDEDDDEEGEGEDGDVDADAEAESESDSEICGTEMSDGSTCERHPVECPYH